MFAFHPVSVLVGVGLGRTPQRFLKAGEVLTSTIEGIGDMRQTFIRR
ncbi:fumarylacetoacetate hydrolase family protein [Sinosporangium album]|nr:fumarylacetoacetate hydrolase family protein [Sinosporangium album]